MTSSTEHFPAEGTVSTEPPAQGRVESTPVPTSTVINGVWSGFLPHQRELWDFEPADDGERHTTIEAILAWYGAGKTEAAARKFLKRCGQLAWTPDYGTRQPQAVVIAPSARILRKVSIPAIKALLPNELIHSERGAPYPSITLVNGCVISFVSAESAFEGETVALIWIDEIDKDAFTQNPERYRNYLARLRDSNQRVLSVIVSGLPTAGWVRETFDLDKRSEEGRRDCTTILASTLSNPYFSSATLDAILATSTEAEARAIRRGTWLQPEGAVFDFDAGLHVTSAVGIPGAPTCVGIDLGNHGAVIFGQRVMVPERDGKQGEGVLVVDQMLPVTTDTRVVCADIKARPWAVSEIYIDPRVMQTDRNIIAEHFPGVHVKQWQPSEELYSIDAGTKRVQVALKNGLGEVHLQFSRSVAGVRSGVIEALETCKRDERTGRIQKNDRNDHPRDALRYLICGMTGPKPIAPRSYRR